MSRHVVSMTIDDVGHYSAEDKARIVASYPLHEREARSSGIPTMGSGRIFPVADELVRVEPCKIPKHWAQIIGLDFGWEHPTAAVRLAWDRDTDTIYVTASYRQKEQVPAIHASAIRPWGEWVPVSWPHDGYQHDKGSGDQLAELYRAQHLNMLTEHATHPEGGNGVEAGLQDMLERMMAGRFKVFGNLNEWFEEFRLYHRVEGKVVKERDDLMAATRYAVMMLRFAMTAPIVRERRSPNIGTIA